MSLEKFRPIPELTPDQIERFNSKVPQGLPADVCWEWQGGRSPRGYGRFAIKYGTASYAAQRVAYYLHTGDHVGQIAVLHRCDNPPCCNPHHLFKGTYADNVHDCWTKGRGRANLSKVRQRGNASPCSKLTDTQVSQIRRTYATFKPRSGQGGGFGMRTLAREYGVSRTLIQRIVQGKHRL